MALVWSLRKEREIERPAVNFSHIHSSSERKDRN